MEKAKKIKILIIICNIIFGILLIPTLIYFPLLGMSFDAPGSEKSIHAIMLFRSIISLPILIILSITFSWVFYRSKKYNIALIIALLPLLSITLIFFFIFI